MAVTDPKIKRGLLRSLSREKVSAELGPDWQQAPRENLVADIIAAMQRQIVSGELAAGNPLPSEGELAAAFGVSRTVIREAMQTLRARGLVQGSQGKRAVVRSVDAQASVESIQLLMRRAGGSLHQLTEVRRPLEIEIAGLAAQRAKPPQIAALRDANRQLAAATDLETAAAADVAFHQRLAEASGNPLFVMLLSTIAGLLEESRRRTIAHSGLRLAVTEHEKILATIEAHEPAEARRAMTRHMQLIERDLSESLER